MRRIITWAVLAAAMLGGLVWAFLPQPVPVDLVEVRRGPMAVTVAADGMARVREPFQVTAPITGTTTRSPVQVGDAVQRGETVVAIIQPMEPALLDLRARLQAEAAVTEARAAVQLAEVNLARTEADVAYAATQLDRNRELQARGIIPLRILEDATQAHATALAAHEAARSELVLARATLARAEAVLVVPDLSPDPANGAAGECCLRLLAPHSGTVLEVTSQSAGLVQAGAPLLSIGDLADLEIEADLLSADAVRVSPGAPAVVDRWGGEGVLEARVRRVDPAAFTRVSALGIEEQRVRVRLDILTPPEERSGLGDRYRVHVRIVVWSAEDVVQVPISALFRQGGDWTVYREVEGRAVATRVETGRRTETEAQVLSGLSPGDRVVAFPGDRISEGVRLAAREAG